MLYSLNDYGRFNTFGWHLILSELIFVNLDRGSLFK
jgi:hypothetical protein